MMSSVRVETIGNQGKFDGLDWKIYLFNVALVLFFGAISSALYQL